MKVACMLEQETYKPGDLPPDGYLAWHEWAEVQRKAGIKQLQCGKCGLWRTPQELSGQTMRWTAQSRKGPVEQTAPICSKCVDPNAELAPWRAQRMNPGSDTDLMLDVYMTAAQREAYNRLRKDAERYRWLREHFRFANDSMRELWFDPVLEPNDSGVPDDLDQEIDHAMSGANAQ